MKNIVRGDMLQRNTAFICQHPEPQTGFTLLELMVVTMIVAILASIAYPSYRRYALLNAERQTQGIMKQLSTELERWRASSLTFRGFYPLKCGNGDRCYDSDNKTIYVPIGSDSNNYKYAITLTSMDNIVAPTGATAEQTTQAQEKNAAANSASLITSGSTVNQSIGRQWQMVAMPNPDEFTGAPKIYLNSRRYECKTLSSTVTLSSMQTDHLCGSGTESMSW